MPETECISIGAAVIGRKNSPLLLIAGPCQIESKDLCLHVARELLKAVRNLPVQLVFKASFDKANRTSLSGIRGPGIDSGLAVLAEVKQRTGLPILTDIHLPEQAQQAAEVADILQIPAFLCRQTDLLTAAGQTGKIVQIKKGQFLHPQDMLFCAQKVAATGNHQILLCERGAVFGYRDLIVDMRSFGLMRSTGYPVVFDATHSVQSLGGAGGSSGGNRDYIYPLARAAAAAGIDGLFLECHPNPDEALSDGPSMLPLVAVRPLIEVVCAIRRVLESQPQRM